MSNDELTKEELATNLEWFTGTETYYKHPLGLYFTDGVHYLAEKAGAYWLIDAIASYLPELKDLEEFQAWTLTRNERGGAVLICEGANPETGEAVELARQEIGVTDFPLDTIKLYLQHGTIDLVTWSWVLMLPNEY